MLAFASATPGSPLSCFSAFSPQPTAHVIPGLTLNVTFVRSPAGASEPDFGGSDPDLAVSVSPPHPMANRASSNTALPREYNSTGDDEKSIKMPSRENISKDRSLNSTRENGTRGRTDSLLTAQPLQVSQHAWLQGLAGAGRQLAGGHVVRKPVQQHGGASFATIATEATTGTFFLQISSSGATSISLECRKFQNQNH